MFIFFRLRDRDPRITRMLAKLHQANVVNTQATLAQTFMGNLKMLKEQEDKNR